MKIQYVISVAAALSLAASAVLPCGTAHAQNRAAAPAEKAAPAPQRVVNYRPLGPEATTPAVIPPVLLSKEHEALCVVKVGDELPAIELNQLGGRRTRLAGLLGKTATVVAFWKRDRPVTRTLLADLGPDVIEPFGERGVTVVGVAIEQEEAAARPVLEKATARFPNLLDTDGKAFALVGKERLPRVYLLDPQGKILWFDIDYSHATRRELNQALRAVTAAQPEPQNN